MSVESLSVVNRIHARVNLLKNIRIILFASGFLLFCLLLPKSVNAWIASIIIVISLSRVLFFQIKHEEILRTVETLFHTKERVITANELDDEDIRKEYIENQIHKIIQENPEKLKKYPYPSIYLSLIFFICALLVAYLDYIKNLPPHVELLKQIDEQTQNPELPNEVQEQFTYLKTAIEVHGLGSKEVETAIQNVQSSLDNSTQEILPPTPTPTATPTSTPESNPSQSPSPTVQADKKSKDGGKSEEEGDKGDRDQGGKKGGDSGKGEGKEKKDDSPGEGKGENKDQQKDGKGDSKSDAQKTLDEAKKEQQKASEEQKKSEGDKKDVEGKQDSQKQDKDGSSKEGDQKKDDAKPSKGESGEKGKDEENKPKGEGKEKASEQSSTKKEDEKQSKSPTSPEGEGGKLSSDSQAPEGKLEDEGEGASIKNKKIDEVSVPGVDEKLNTEEVGREGRLTNKEEESAYKRKLEEMNDMKSNPALESGNQYIPKEYERYIK